MKKFWKILAVLFVVVFILLTVVIVAGFFFLKNFDISKYKGQIIQTASQSLGRPVDLKDISLKVSLAEGVRLHLSDFSIGENPDFGTGSFVSVGEIDARLDILAFIMEKRVSLPNVLIRSPQITIIRNAQGLLNAQTIGQSPAAPAVKSQGSVPPGAVLPALLVNSFKVENARINFIDKGTQPQQEITIKQLNLAVRNFSLTNPFDVAIDAAVLSPETNLTVNGKAQLVLSTQGLKVSALEAVFDLGQLPLDDLRRMPMLNGLPVPQVLKGKVKANIREAAFSDKGLNDLVMDVALEQGQIAVSDIAPGISFTANAINIAARNFSFSDVFDVNASLGLESETPNVFFNGKAALDIETQNLRLSPALLKADLAQIPFERFKETLAPLKAVPLPQVLKGEVEIALQEFSAGPKGLNALKADVSLRNGLVSMKEVAPGISFEASSINAYIKNFGLGTPFDFSIELAYLNNEPNIKAQGGATLRMEDQSVVLKDVLLETELSTLALDQLKTSVEALKSVSLPEKLKGKFNLTLAEAVIGAKGLVSLTGQGALKGGEVKMKELIVPIQGVDTNFHLTQKDLTMDAIQARLGKGQITAEMGMSDYLTLQNFTLSAVLKEIDLSEILDQQQAPVKVLGLVSGDLKAQGRATDMNSITGQGNFGVKQAKLKDFNVLKTVLDKISFLPNVAQGVEASLPDKYKEKLKSPDTEINNISMPVTIANGLIVLDPISIEADEFIFGGKCQAGFDQKYTLDGAVKIPAELSKAMTQGVAELQYLYDQDSQISLPVHVSGQGSQAPVISVKQTAIEMGKNAMINEGKTQLEKALNKILGGEEQPSSTDGQNTQPEQAGEPTQDSTSPAAEIIGDILDKILK